MDRSKCDLSTDNGNYNKDTKPLWCDCIPVCKVQPNQKLHSARGLPKLNGKFHFVNFIKLVTPTVSPKYIWYVVIPVRI